MRKSNLRSIEFQKALLELAYTNYPGVFFQQVKNLLDDMMIQRYLPCALNILLQQKNDPLLVNTIKELLDTKFAEQGIINPVLYMLQIHISEQNKTGTFLSKKFT